MSTQPRALLCVWLIPLAMAPVALAQDVAYEKYQLKNGMTVILHEDHSVPAACVNLWYYVASKDEAVGRSGFAHLFEHLMFMGTNRVPNGEFDTIMESGGGFNNASTSSDRTNYFSMGPSELLPTLLWLDADRLDELGKAMTLEKLNKQRDVVRNERRQVTENRPYGTAEERVGSLMYPDGHPYHHSVIGSHEDLQAGTVEDVKKFFATYYVPSNGSLVVAGDFDPAEIKPLIEELFGGIPRGADVVHASAEPVRLGEVRRMTMTDKVQFAKTYMVYHSPKRFGPGDAEMDLAAAVLSVGISSRLYQKLVYENEYAVDVQAYQASQLLGSLFYIEATAKPGVSLDTVEGAIDEVVAEFTSNGPTADELERQKAKIEYRFVARLQSILGKADRLNFYQFFFGEPNSFKRDLDRFRQATPVGVRNVARDVLTPDSRLVLRVIPQIETPQPSPLNDRPTVAGAKPFAPLLPETFKLSNGITVHHWRRSELPLIDLSMLLPFGTTSDPADGAGLATLTADMLDEGAGARGAIEFADALDQLGARFNASSGYESTTARLSVLSRNFKPALALYADAIRRPRFDEKEWQRVHGLHLQDLKRALDQPTYVARTVAMRTFFGDAHAFSRPTSGTNDTATSVTLADAKRFHRRLFRPSNAVFLIAGDLSAAEAKRQLEAAFGDWEDPTDVAAVSTPKYGSPSNQGFRVAIVDRPDAVQTVVNFIMPGPVYADPSRIKLQLFNTILGGSFTSRLNQNLREEHGYTYGARCGYQMNTAVGYFTATSSVRADVTGASIGEFLSEFSAIRGGDVSAEEAGKARSSRRMSMIRSFAGLGGIIGAATTIVRNGRPFSDMGEALQAMAKIHETDLNRLAYTAVPLEKGLLVLVGDKKQILEQLKGLDLPTPIELTLTGDAVKAP